MNILEEKIEIAKMLLDVNNEALLQNIKELIEKENSINKQVHHVDQENLTDDFRNAVKEVKQYKDGKASLNTLNQLLNRF